MATTQRPTDDPRETTVTDVAAPLGNELQGVDTVTAVTPNQLAWRRLKRNKVSLAFVGLFIVLVLSSLLAPACTMQDA